MAPIIRTEKLRKVYAVGKERVVALNDVDLAIEKGEFCCIVGQSGSGKSTLLNMLAGLEKPTRGKVFIGKHEISAMTETELARFRQAHLGFIFQSYNLLPTMTAAENVALPLLFKGVDKASRMRLARKELKQMGLLGRANHLPTEMSGGQQQRVGIARAFVSSPQGDLRRRAHRQPGLHDQQTGALPHAGNVQTPEGHLRHGHPRAGNWPSVPTASSPFWTARCSPASCRTTKPNRNTGTNCLPI